MLAPQRRVVLSAVLLLCWPHLLFHLAWWWLVDGLFCTRSTVYSRSPLEGCPGCLASGVDTVLTMLVISTLLDGGLW